VSRVAVSVRYGPVMGADIRVEPMTPADWAAVRAIYEQGIATGVATFETTAPDWEGWDAAHRPEHRLVARDRDGRVIGWVAVSSYSTRRVYAGVVEESVYVAEVARGRGVGRALLERLIAETDAAGIWTVQAGIQSANLASLALHEHAGFRRVGVRERIGRDAQGRWCDVVLMERRSARIE
jgi:L-amino acid N-acyltransferase YncA